MNRWSVLPLATAAFTLGIAVAGYIGQSGARVGSSVWLVAAAGCIALAVSSGRWGRPAPSYRLPLALVCMATLGGWAADLQWELWQGWVAVLTDSADLQVWGTVSEDAAGQIRLVPSRICVNEYGSVRCLPGRLPGLQWRSTREAAQKPVIGQSVWAQGQFSPLQPPANHGGYDAVAYGLRQGVVGELQVRTWQVYIYQPPFWLGVRTRWQERIADVVPGEPGQLVTSMVLGGTAHLADTTKTALQRAGLSHVTSVSGLHVGLVAGFVWLLLRGRDGARGLLGIVAALLFTLLSGGQPPAMRAVIGAAIAVFFQSSGRQINTWTGLTLAWFCLLLANPALLGDIGFGLSFASVAGILALGKPLLRRVPAGAGGAQRCAFWVRNALIISISAQAGAAYLTVQAFQTISVMGPLANLLGVPLATATLLAGLSGSLVGVGAGHSILIDAVSRALLQVAGWLAASFLLVAKWVAGLSWAVVEVPVMHPLVGLAWFTALGTVAVGVNWWRLPLAWRRLGALVVARWCAAGLLVWGGVGAIAWAAADELCISFFAVGQGDAILIVAPGKQAVLVDAGGVGSNWDASQVIIPQLRRRGIHKLYAVVNTHPHADHLGGMAGVIEARSVEWVLDTGATADTSTYHRYRQALVEKGVTMRLTQAGDAMQLGKVQLQVLWPPRGYSTRVAKSADANQGSIVLLVTYGDVAVLLTGDATRETQAALLASGWGRGVVLWKVPHQGAMNNFYPPFVSNLQPAVSVISVGPNRYGHPAPAVVNALKQHGLVCRTDVDGAVELVTNGRSWRVSSAKGKNCRKSGYERQHQEQRM